MALLELDRLDRRLSQESDQDVGRVALGERLVSRSSEDDPVLDVDRAAHLHYEVRLAADVSDTEDDLVEDFGSEFRHGFIMNAKS